MSKDERELYEARSMVAILVAAYHKPEWEEGTTLEEAISTARDCLFNWGMDPACNPLEFERAIGVRDEQG